MKKGILKVVKLGSDYGFHKQPGTGRFEFRYEDAIGEKKREMFDWVVDARGQERSFEKNTSKLAKNLLSSGTVQIEELIEVDRTIASGRLSVGDENRVMNGFEKDPQNRTYAYRTGALLIDPETHGIIKRDKEGTDRISEKIYAVGAMTRGQIIDASTAYGCARSTAKIADRLIKHIIRVQSKSRS
jgi:hypothetical protein